MSVLELFAIAIVLMVCLYVSYTDTKFRKIGNPYIYGLALFGLACQGVFVYPCWLRWTVPRPSSWFAASKASTWW